MFAVVIYNIHTKRREVHPGFDIETMPGTSFLHLDKMEVHIGQRHFNRADSSRVIYTDQPIEIFPFLEKSK